MNEQNHRNHKNLKHNNHKETFVPNRIDENNDKENGK